jgi:hypothetical protein
MRGVTTHRYPVTYSRFSGRLTGAHTGFPAKLLSTFTELARFVELGFRERPTMEHAFHWKCGSPVVLMGHIRCDEKGFYQYYRGPLNQLIFEFEDDDLDRMKQRVAAREEPSPTY